jgi:RNA polymerase sigma-70 factor (ECF subfamily)
MKKTDQQLIIEAISKTHNSNKAFEEIVDRYKNYVFQICYSKLHNVEEAEDAAQEIFVRVYFGLEKFRFESEFKTWLTQITLNVTLTMLLSNKRKFWKNFVSNDGDIDIDTIYRSTFTTGQEEYFWSTVGTILYKMIQPYRKVFIFKYFKNFNLEKISKKIESTIGATKMKLKRAKDQFIKFLTE